MCGAERLLSVSFAARRRERSARLRSVAPSSKQRGPQQPRRIVSRLADAALKLVQPNRAADNTSVAPQEEVDDDKLVLVAEQEPRVTAPAPRGALASYCRLLRSQTLDWRDTTVVVPHVNGQQLLALAAWLNREPLRYDKVAAACIAGEALDIPLLLRDVDLWMEARETQESTNGGAGVFGAFNLDFRYDYSRGLDISLEAQKAKFRANGKQDYDFAMYLAKNHRLPRFRKALLASLKRLPEQNARQLLLHVAQRELQDNAKQ